jgi:hypothetical protein
VTEDPPVPSTDVGTSTPIPPRPQRAELSPSVSAIELPVAVKDPIELLTSQETSPELVSPSLSKQFPEMTVSSPPKPQPPPTPSPPPTLLNISKPENLSTTEVTSVLLNPSSNPNPNPQVSQPNHGNNLLPPNPVSPFPHTSSPPFPSHGDGVYLSGGRTASLSPAFGADSLQRDHVRRSMSTTTNTGKNLAGITSMSIPRITPGEKGNLSEGSLLPLHRPLVSGNGISDFLGDNTVSLLSNVPAAMQSQQQYLALAMNSSGSNSPFLNSGVSIDSGGPYLLGTKVTGTLTSSGQANPPKSNTASKSVGRPSRPDGASKTKGKGQDARLKPANSANGTTFTSDSPTSISPRPTSPSTSNGQSRAESESPRTTTPTFEMNGNKISIKVEPNDGSIPIPADPPAKRKRDHPRSNSARSSGGGSQSKTSTSSESLDEETLLLLQNHETLKLKLNLLERKETLAHRAPAFHVPRLKSHWDYLLEEMQWMAVDFHQERRWKLSQCQAIAQTCANKFRECKEEEEEEEEEEEYSSLAYDNWVTNLGTLTRRSIYEPIRKRKFNNPTEQEIDQDLLGESKRLAKKLCETFNYRILNHHLLSRPQLLPHQPQLSPPSSPSQEDQITQEINEVIQTTELNSSIVFGGKVKRECLNLDELIKQFEIKFIQKVNEIKTLLRFESTQPHEGLQMVPSFSEHRLKNSQNNLLHATHQRIDMGLGPLIYGKHHSGKTMTTAALVYSWLQRNLSKKKRKSPMLIVCSEFMFFRWKYEIKKYFESCQFCNLDELLFVTKGRNDEKSVEERIQQIEESDVVLCSSLEIFCRISNTATTINWCGYLLDIRMLDKQQSDVDSPSLGTDSSPPNDQSLAKVQETFASWINGGRDLFSKSNVPRCCLSNVNFLPQRMSSSSHLDQTPLISFLSAWLLFSSPFYLSFETSVAEVLSGDQWLKWSVSSKIQERPFLFDDLFPLCCLELTHWSPTEWQIKDQIQTVDMSPSHSLKYLSVVNHLNQSGAVAPVFQASFSSTDKDFQNFAGALILLQKLCFHEDFLHISQRTNRKHTSRSSTPDTWTTSMRFLPWLPHWSPIRSSPKLEYLMRILHSKKNEKIIVIVNSAEEALYTHAYLETNSVSHLYAGVNRSYPQDDMLFDHWFVAQHAIMKFNDSACVPNASSNILLISGWLLRVASSPSSSTPLDQLELLTSSFDSFPSPLLPNSADLIIALSCDWTHDFDFSNWFMNSRGPHPEIIRVVFDQTLEHHLIQKYSESILTSINDDEVRDSCLLNALIGIPTKNLFPIPSLTSTFLSNAPLISSLQSPLSHLLSDQPITGVPTSSPQTLQSAHLLPHWIQALRSLLLTLHHKFSFSKNNSMISFDASADWSSLPLVLLPTAPLPCVTLPARPIHRTRLWRTLFDSFIFQNNSLPLPPPAGALLSYLLKLQPDLAHPLECRTLVDFHQHSFQLDQNNNNSFLSSSSHSKTQDYHRRFMNSGYGISSSEYLLRNIYEPYLQPQLSREDKTKEITLHGVDAIGAYKLSKYESERQGHLTDPLLYTNPLQISTGRDVVECPSWLTARYFDSVKFSISYGTSSMTTDPSGEPNPDQKGKQRSKGARKTSPSISVDTTAALVVSTTPRPTGTSGVDEQPPPPVVVTAITPSVVTLSTGTPKLSNIPKNKFSGPSRYNPYGSGWHKVNPIIQKQEESASVPTVAAAFLSTMPLGRDGKKYRNSGEKRAGGFSPSVIFSNSQPNGKPLLDIGLPNSAQLLSDLPHHSPPLGIKFDRKSQNSSGLSPSLSLLCSSMLGNTSWSGAEVISLNKALSMINPDPQAGQRCSGSGWLQERYLDQVSSLVESSHRSARQALGYSDLLDQPHRKRHHDELLHHSSQEDSSSSSLSTTDPSHISKKYLQVTDALAIQDKRIIPNFQKLIPDDPPRLPTHTSHEVTSLNPSLKPYQILALTRDQPNPDMQQHYYSRGGGGGGGGGGGTGGGNGKSRTDSERDTGRSNSNDYNSHDTHTHPSKAGLNH